MTAMPSTPATPTAARIGARLSLLSRLLQRDGAVGFDDLPLGAAVRLAYNVLLEREPDPAGMEHYLTQMRSGKLTRAGLLEALRTSDERKYEIDLVRGDAAVAEGPRVAAHSTWPSFPPDQYLGQLTDDFQRSLARERAALRREDCKFYHCIDLPDGEAITGPWDLRGRENAYLGGVNVKGKRVLEVGPSSGYLGFWMERQGADVVGFDCGYDCSIDLLPTPDTDIRRLRYDHALMTASYQYGWWYCHRKLDSKVKIAYGDVYRMPGDLGTFDVATFGAILLHCKSPIGVLEQGARRTTDTIVVTDGWTGGEGTLMENIMRPFPIGEAGRWVIWWELSAGAVVQMLEVLGFGDTTVTTHTQLHQHRHDPDAPYVEQPMYTVVGRRRR